MSHADLITLDSAGLQYQIAHARQLLRSRYGAAVNWFCYPSGHYNSTVIDAVRAAGFVGSTTVVPGWAAARTIRTASPACACSAGRAARRCWSRSRRSEHASAPPPSYGGA